MVSSYLNTPSRLSTRTHQPPPKPPPAQYTSSRYIRSTSEPQKTPHKSPRPTIPQKSAAPHLPSTQHPTQPLQPTPQKIPIGATRAPARHTYMHSTNLAHPLTQPVSFTCAPLRHLSIASTPLLSDKCVNLALTPTDPGRIAGSAWMQCRMDNASPRPSCVECVNALAPKDDWWW